MKNQIQTLPKETPEEELKRLRKENSKLKAQKEADKAKILRLEERTSKKKKKKDVPTITVTEEQRSYFRACSRT